MPSMLKHATGLFSKALLCGFAGFLGGCFAYLYHPVALPARTPEVVTARQFRVIDPSGRLLADLSTSGLNLYGEDGRIRATLRLHQNDNGLLGFSDGKVEGRVTFGFLGSDTPSPKDDDWGLMIRSPEMDRAVISLMTGDNGRDGRLVVGNRSSSRVFAIEPF